MRGHRRGAPREPRGTAEWRSLPLQLHTGSVAEAGRINRHDELDPRHVVVLDAHPVPTRRRIGLAVRTLSARWPAASPMCERLLPPSPELGYPARGWDLTPRAGRTIQPETQLRTASAPPLTAMRSTQAERRPVHPDVARSDRAGAVVPGPRRRWLNVPAATCNHHAHGASTRTRIARRIICSARAKLNSKVLDSAQFRGRCGGLALSRASARPS